MNKGNGLITMYRRGAINKLTLEWILDNIFLLTDEQVKAIEEKVENANGLKSELKKASKDEVAEMWYRILYGNIPQLEQKGQLKDGVKATVERIYNAYTTP